MAARYDIMTRRVVMELSSGSEIGIPLSRLAEIARAQAEDLEAVEVVGGGSILHWERLNADYSVRAVIRDLSGEEG